MTSRLYTIAGCIAIAAMLAAGCASNEQKPTGAQQAGAPADNGKMIFEQKCAMCHGSDGAAGIGNAASLPKSTLDSTALTILIANGRNSMPAFKDQLTAAQIGDVAGYVLRLRK